MIWLQQMLFQIRRVKLATRLKSERNLRPSNLRCAHKNCRCWPTGDLAKRFERLHKAQGLESAKPASGEDGRQTGLHPDRHGIEKSAKQIRSDFGGSKDEELESPPSTLEDALKQLNETGTQLNEQLAKTSRQVISIPVVERATDIIQLVRILRTFLK